MKFSQFFQDDTGALSAMRLMFIVWGLGVFVTWTVLSIIAKQMQPIPSGVIEILGMCIGGKVIQAFSENSTTITSNQPVTQVVQPIQPTNIPPGFQLPPQFPPTQPH